MRLGDLVRARPSPTDRPACIYQIGTVAWISGGFCIVIGEGRTSGPLPCRWWAELHSTEVQRARRLYELVRGAVRSARRAATPAAKARHLCRARGLRAHARHARGSSLAPCCWCEGAGLIVGNGVALPCRFCPAWRPELGGARLW